MPGSRNSAAIFAAFVFLSGCASLQDMRSQPPQMSAIVPGNYAELAECFSSRTDEIRDWPAVLRIDRTKRRANVYEIVQNQATTYDYTFIQVGEKVQVEARGMDTIFGKDHHPKAVWHLIGECSAGQ